MNNHQTIHLYEHFCQGTVLQNKNETVPDSLKMDIFTMEDQEMDPSLGMGLLVMEDQEMDHLIMKNQKMDRITTEDRLEKDHTHKDDLQRILVASKDRLKDRF